MDDCRCHFKCRRIWLDLFALNVRPFYESTLSRVIISSKLSEFAIVIRLAVFAAYRWKSDLSDEEILEKLLAFGSLRYTPGVLRNFGEGEARIKYAL